MNALRSLVIAFSMYSRIPMPAVEWTQPAMRLSMAFLPLVGFVQGLLAVAFGCVALALELPEPIVAACLALLPVLVNGGIHLDGLADASDALASHQSREKKLEILKDSHIGAFGAIAIACHLILSCAAYASMELSWQTLWALPCVFALSRAASAWAVVSWPKARKEGTVKGFSDAASKTPTYVLLLLFALAASLALLALQGAVGMLVLAALLLALLQYRYTAMKHFGGVSGDVAGWFLENAELYMLVALAMGGALS